MENLDYKKAKRIYNEKIKTAEEQAQIEFLWYVEEMEDLANYNFCMEMGFDPDDGNMYFRGDDEYNFIGAVALWCTNWMLNNNPDVIWAYYYLGTENIA